MEMPPGRRCDWREHPFGEMLCGHVSCLTCHPERFAADATCDHCEDAYEAVDELLADDVELHCG
jgi:hypothetical protein